MRDTKSIQKSLSFLYTNNKKSERATKESIAFTIATKRIKYLGINLPKETKELYTENYETLMKEINDNINRWGDIPCYWIWIISIVKMTILPNAIYRFNVLPTKLPMPFLTELKQKISTMHMGAQKKPEWPKQSWERRMELEESTFLTSGYTTKLQSSRQDDTGTKTEIQTNATRQKAQK